MPPKKSNSPSKTKSKSPSANKAGSVKKATSPKKKTPLKSDPTVEKKPAAKKKSRQSENKDKEEEPSLKRRRTSSGPVVTEEAVREGTIPFQRKSKDSDFDPKTMMKIICWNVAGLRAVCRNGTELEDLVKKENPDLLCVQEVKIHDLDECARTGVLDGYTFSDCASLTKKGYSGTRTYVRDGFKATPGPRGFSIDSGARPDEEGRVYTTLLDESQIAVINNYVPNSGLQLDRLDYRVEEFDPMMRQFLKEMQEAYPNGVIWTGDLNVAERDYDRFFNNFKAMQKCPGFTPEERASFRKTLEETGMIDSFRSLYPNANDTYTFWSKKFNQKEKNNGWRLDYFIVSAKLKDKVVDVFPLPEYITSDHCPLVLWLKK